MRSDAINLTAHLSKIIDVSGKKRFRLRSWSEYYEEIHGIIFVIDANDKGRLTENRQTLVDLFENDKLRNRPMLL